MNTVKIKRKPAGDYHHGALRPALLAAAVQVLEERGLDGFSLREAARRAGVSPAAPAHHFGDTPGLLTAIATESFVLLAEAIEAADAAAGPDRAARVRGQGHAYVRYAVTNRARYDLMWRPTLFNASDAAYVAASLRAFLSLDRAVRGVTTVEETSPCGLESAQSIACWSLVHGFARLAIDGMFGRDRDAARRAADALLPAVLSHLDLLAPAPAAAAGGAA
jgi:AcrR family transcriptional regulator